MEMSWVRMTNLVAAEVKKEIHMQRDSASELTIDESRNVGMNSRTQSCEKSRICRRGFEKL